MTEKSDFTGTAESRLLEAKDAAFNDVQSKQPEKISDKMVLTNWLTRRLNRAETQLISLGCNFGGSDTGENPGLLRECHTGDAECHCPINVPNDSDKEYVHYECLQPPVSVLSRQNLMCDCHKRPQLRRLNWSDLRFIVVTVENGLLWNMTKAMDAKIAAAVTGISCDVIAAVTIKCKDGIRKLKPRHFIIAGHDLQPEEKASVGSAKTKSHGAKPQEHLSKYWSFLADRGRHERVTGSSGRQSPLIC
ncbi:unnamed protein product [Soboliphyme baturini]|uniref:Ribosomal_L7Ae domain-containing protein n=1 Tax=Soboliphyme baturini TaxID=241478 RepID=A0A183IJD8_9BILA|nr:unnamed protein product [Soboliphyme baturini]